MSFITGFPATLEIRENLENEFSNFPVRENSGNLGKTQKKSGKNQGICDSDPGLKGFRQFGYVRLVPCVQVVFID